MRQRLFLLVLSLLIVGTAEAKQSSKAPIDENTERIVARISSADCFALDRLTPQEYDFLPEILRLHVDVILASRFNDLRR